MKVIKKIWKFLDGNKRNIGWLIAMTGTGLRVFGVVPIEQANFITEVGLGIGAIGTGHAWIKDGSVSKINNSLKNISKQKN